MGCLLLLFGLLGPRVGTVLLWLFTDRMSQAYENGVVPVIGFFIAPWTTFTYALAAGGGNGVGGFGSFMIFIGVVLDVVSLVGARREQVNRMQSPTS